MRKSERQIRRGIDFAIIFRVRWVGVMLANRSVSLRHRCYGEIPILLVLVWARRPKLLPIARASVFCLSQ
jgi:hypothetical protein